MKRNATPIKKSRKRLFCATTTKGTTTGRIEELGTREHVSKRVLSTPSPNMAAYKKRQKVISPFSKTPRPRVLAATVHSHLSSVIKTKKRKLKLGTHAKSTSDESDIEVNIPVIQCH